MCYRVGVRSGTNGKLLITRNTQTVGILHEYKKHPTKPGRVTVKHPDKDIPRETLDRIERPSGLRSGVLTSFVIGGVNDFSKRSDILSCCFSYSPGEEISVVFPDLDVSTSGIDDKDAFESARELLCCRNPCPTK